ncbi:MAG: radical SAM protein [Elusimicrobiales bacterium]|nr:radical SAM protein [Elusimicrobiales bacterium]
MDKKVDIKITFNCNNLCDFCAQGSKREHIKPKSLQEIEISLKKGIDDGAKTLVLTGGEPTLHPDIIKIILKAKQLGYQKIQLQTNGRTLCNENFLKQLINAGVNEISPAVHGHIASLHDKLTHSPGSFNQTITGIKNAKKHNIYVLTNTVITSLNYKYLPEIAKLLVYLKVDQFQFAFIHIIGRGWENRSWIVPKKTDILPYLYKGLDIGKKANIPCYTEAIPYCLMKRYEECVVEKIIPDGPVFDADVFVENYGNYRKNEGKTKNITCKKCIYYKICEGPWREYPQIYGWSEFKPVKPK